MATCLESTKKFFDEKGFRYEDRKDGKAIRLGIGGLKNLEGIRVSVIFDDNDRTVAVRSYELCKIPEAKLDKLHELCSDLNAKYRWVKFYVDSEDNTITIESDLITTPEEAGAEIFEVVGRMSVIVDQAYPDIMKALWS